MFIHIRPVDDVSRSNDAEIGSLPFGRMQETWIPGKRNGDRPSIEQIDR
jgi:hypothetical protein